MDGGFAYSKDKLALAVRWLATGTGSIHQRLEDAADELRAIIIEHYWHDELHAMLAAIMHDLTSVPAQGSEGPIYATIHSMTNEQAKELAERILDLHNAMQA